VAHDCTMWEALLL